MSDSTYCVKCRRKTPDVNPQVIATANNRRALKSTCKVCGTKKTRFLSGNPPGGPPINRVRKSKSRSKKRSGGSVWGSTIGGLLGGAASLIPGVGWVAGPVLGAAGSELGDKLF